VTENNLLDFETNAEIEKIIGQLTKISDQLKSPQILQTALKNTARKVRAQLVKEAQEKYATSDKNLLRNNKKTADIISGKGAEAFAEIKSQGEMLDIMNFMTRPNTKTGAAAAKVFNSGDMKALERDGSRAFVTRFRSGHVAIVQRVPRKEYEEPGKTNRAEKYGKNADMTKIKKILSPSVPHQLGSGQAIPHAQSLVYETMQAEIQKVIEQTTAAAR
jgi:hypothetical protein